MINAVNAFGNSHDIKIRVGIHTVRWCRLTSGLNPGLKAFGFQPVESTSLSKFWFSEVNLHPYNMLGRCKLLGG